MRIDPTRESGKGAGGLRFTLPPARVNACSCCCIYNAACSKCTERTRADGKTRFVGIINREKEKGRKGEMTLRSVKINVDFVDLVSQLVQARIRRSIEVDYFNKFVSASPSFLYTNTRTHLLAHSFPHRHVQVSTIHFETIRCGC